MTKQSILDLQVQWSSIEVDWGSHHLGHKRAQGGRNALSGFLYQLYVSLDYFFEALIQGDSSAQFCFDGLSDVARFGENLIYLTQIKTTADLRALRSAAEESIAVTKFIRDERPELEGHLRFQLVVRRRRSQNLIDIKNASLKDLGIAGEDPMLWERVRGRFLPVTVHAHPRVELAIKLSPRVGPGLKFVDGCLSCLFRHLGENADSQIVSEALLELWGAAQVDEKPPGHLLGLGQLSDGNHSSTRVVHGLRPRPQDLATGCFMDRPNLMNETVSELQKALKEVEDPNKPSRIPVFWIAGPSGAGKSVLLLQLTKELVIREEAELANYLAEYPHLLSRSLAYWANAKERVLIVVDDIYDPRHRNLQEWQKIAAESTFSFARTKPPVILSCGSEEQLEEFRWWASSHPEFYLHKHSIPALTPEEKQAFHDWFQTRTGSRVPFSHESIFVAATWTYELHRKADLQPEGFSRKFLDRLRELGLARPARAALALNQYGLAAPTGLFDGLEAQLSILKRERIYRDGGLGRADHGGMIFHAGIARTIYDVIAPEDRYFERADDLAFAFRALTRDKEAAIGFIAWLSKSKTRRLIGTEVRELLLKKMWSVFSDVGAKRNTVLPLKKWYDLALREKTDLLRLGLRKDIRNWFQNSSPVEYVWEILYQIVWDLGDESDRTKLYIQGKNWLRTNQDSPSWSWIFPELWEFSDEDPDLVEMGLSWLDVNTEDIGWSYVWQLVFEARLDDARLLKSALQAIPNLPGSRAAPHIWKKVESLEPDKRSLIAAITRQLATINDLAIIQEGISYILSTVDTDEFDTFVIPELRESQESKHWSLLWQFLAQEFPYSGSLLELGFSWLNEKEECQEWSYVWRRLVTSKFEPIRTLRLGYKWLDRREDHPSWYYIWDELIKNDYKTAALLERGFLWLEERETQASWTHVLRTLLQQRYRMGELIRAAIRWLEIYSDRLEWAPTWGEVLEIEIKREYKLELLSLGLDWLDDREDRPEWSYVWRDLMKHSYRTDRLISTGTTWLSRSDNIEGWSFVWEVLIDTVEDNSELLEQGWDWLWAHRDRKDWAYVWKGLAKYEYRMDELLLLGREWVKSHRDHIAYDYLKDRIAEFG